MDEISWTNVAVMTYWMMFCDIIGFIDVAGLPDEVNDITINVITHPKVAHVHAFGFSWFHGIMEKAMTNFVVGD